MPGHLVTEPLVAGHLRWRLIVMVKSGEPVEVDFASLDGQRATADAVAIGPELNAGSEQPRFVLSGREQHLAPMRVKAHSDPQLDMAQVRRQDGPLDAISIDNNQLSSSDLL